MWSVDTSPCRKSFGMSLRKTLSTHFCQILRILTNFYSNNHNSSNTQLHSKKITVWRESSHCKIQCVISLSTVLHTVQRKVLYTWLQYTLTAKPLVWGTAGLSMLIINAIYIRGSQHGQYIYMESTVHWKVLYTWLHSTFLTAIVPIHFAEKYFKFSQTMRYLYKTWIIFKEWTMIPNNT